MGWRKTGIWFGIRIKIGMAMQDWGGRAEFGMGLGLNGVRLGLGLQYRIGIAVQD